MNHETSKSAQDQGNQEAILRNLLKEGIRKDSSKEKQDEAFQFQLELLKMEIEIIDRSIARLDEITQTTKNWAVLIWSGGIAVSLGQADLRPYILLTTVIPILFWLIDARWRYYLRGFIFRQDKISDFVNSNDLLLSFKQNKVQNLRILDPRGAQYRSMKEYQRVVNFRRALNYPEVRLIYFGMIAISVTIEIIFALRI